MARIAKSTADKIASGYSDAAANILEQAADKYRYRTYNPEKSYASQHGGSTGLDQYGGRVPDTVARGGEPQNEFDRIISTLGSTPEKDAMTQDRGLGGVDPSIVGMSAFPGESNFPGSEQFQGSGPPPENIEGESWFAKLMGKAEPTELGDSAYGDTMIKDQQMAAGAKRTSEGMSGGPEEMSGAQLAGEEAKQFLSSASGTEERISGIAGEQVPMGDAPPKGWVEPDPGLENVPFQETQHGFHARNYATEGLKSPPQVGTADWARREYPRWAFNMPDEQLEIVMRNPDWFRKLQADTGNWQNPDVTPDWMTQNIAQAPAEFSTDKNIQPVINELVQTSQKAMEESWKAKQLFKIMEEETGLSLDMFSTGNYNNQDVHKLFNFMSNPRYKSAIMKEYPDIWSVFMKFINMAS